MNEKKVKFVKINENVPHSRIYHYDIVILGAGPAGLAAAIYTSRYGMKTALIAQEIGGMASYAEKIENYPGFEGPGSRLMNKFYKQAKKFGAEFLKEDVISLQKDDNGLIIAVSQHKMIHTKSIIIALGTQRRKLNVPGEDKFLGKGVSYCATCDGNFFKNKDVAVIGGGDTALREALFLSKICKTVTVVHRRNELRAQAILQDKAKSTKNINNMA